MYSVLWTARAQAELAAAWLAAPSEVRQQMTAVMAEFDRYLRANGPRLGESREDDVRVLMVPPIGIEYRWSEDDRTVTVFRAWRIHPRKL